MTGVQLNEEAVPASEEGSRYLRSFTTTSRHAVHSANKDRIN